MPIWTQRQRTNLSEKAIRYAANMMTEVINKEIAAGKHPMSLAATVLYISSTRYGENITQVEIANAAGITEVTLRNRLKDLNLRRDVLVVTITICSTITNRI